jgi:hypothetical protein
MGKPKPASQWAESGTSPIPALTNFRNVASNTAEDAAIVEDAATTEDPAIRMLVAHENVLLVALIFINVVFLSKV